MIAVRAWVRAVTGGRRRIVAYRPGASLVLAIRPAARRMPRGPAVVHHHHHRHDHHHTDAHRLPAAVSGQVRSARGPLVAGLQRARPSIARSAGRRIVAADRHATHAAVRSRAPRAAAPARAGAARRTAAAIGAAHRRVETFAPPPLTAAAASPRDTAPARPARPPRPPRPAPPVPAAPPAARRPAPARRPAMVVRPLAQASRPAPAEVPGRALPAPRARAGAVAAAPEVDIEQLTERVVRQIDRRIVAHRERLGQI